METVEQMWEQCKTLPIRTVAQMNGRTTKELIAEFQQHGLCGNGKADPSPDEIRRECNRIRAMWDEQTEHSRWVAARRNKLFV
jgi:hypothetical protein